MGQKTLIQHASIITENQIIENGYLLIEGSQISTMGSMKQLKDRKGMKKVITLSPQYTLIPGMIDVHIHGADGADVMDATPEALQTIASALPQEGTTSFYATTMTQEAHAIERALINAATYIKQQELGTVAECMGVHLEGPFISKKQAGAQPVDHIVPPDIRLFQQWQELAEQHICLVTFAPEEENGDLLTRYLKSAGVIASIGHSDATYAQVRQAIANGTTHVTHLYNGMRGLHHREPGVVGAALLSSELMVELIVDGIHSCPEMVHFAFQNAGSRRLILITDAMRAKCLKSGQYELGRQSVWVSDVDARLADGTLAGSVLTMNQGMMNMMKYGGCSLPEVVRMTSYNAAQELRILDRKGSLAVGKDADVVVLDENYQVVQTYCRGHLAYESGGQGSL